MLIGKTEAVVTAGPGSPQSQNQDRNRKSGRGSEDLVGFVVRIVASFWKKSFVELSRILTNCPTTVCPHGNVESSCLVYILKVFVSGTGVAQGPRTRYDNETPLRLVYTGVFTFHTRGFHFLRGCQLEITHSNPPTAYTEVISVKSCSTKFG